MKAPVVIIGIGEIGSVLARGLLRTGHPVYPVNRGMDLAAVSRELPAPEAVIVAVGEAALHDVLPQIPAQWQDRLVLIQNELLPDDWQRYELEPTVISVWFEKKKGQDVKVVVASPVFGSKATLLVDALEALEIPAYVVEDAARMTSELVRKNYYILTSNIAGLRTGGTVGELWSDHNAFARSVIDDVHKIQQFLVSGSSFDSTLDKQSLTEAMLAAFDGDPQHGCMGRSAPARLKRALAIAEKGGFDVPTLSAIAEQDLPERV